MRKHRLAVAFAASLFPALAARADTCSNVVIADRYYFDISPQGEISAQGTLRIFGEDDPKSQPDYNLTQIECERKGEMECRVRRTKFLGEDDKKICMLTTDVTDFKMKEVRPGILVGIASVGMDDLVCFDTILTINRNTKRATISFERTRYTGSCSVGTPKPQTLMNCGTSAAIRAAKQSMPPTPPDEIFSLRRCDFIIGELKIFK